MLAFDFYTHSIQGPRFLLYHFAGLFFFAMCLQSKDAEVMLKLGSTPDKREQYRLMRDAMEKRFIRVTQGSIIGGVRLGVFSASFCGLQEFLAEKRGIHDVFNVAAAGSATAAAFGLICKKKSYLLRLILYTLFFSQLYLSFLGFFLVPGSIAWRARNMMMGSILGAAVCFPIGTHLLSSYCDIQIIVDSQGVNMVIL